MNSRSVAIDDDPVVGANVNFRDGADKLEIAFMAHGEVRGEALGGFADMMIIS